MSESTRTALYHRMETVHTSIREAESAGLDTTALEEFFVQLLRRYEAMCEEEDAPVEPLNTNPWLGLSYDQATDLLARAKTGNPNDVTLLLARLMHVSWDVVDAQRKQR